MDSSVFTGGIPALMTPCTPTGEPDFEGLVQKGHELINLGMTSVVYCGSMGDWPLLTDAQCCPSCACTHSRCSWTQHKGSG